MQQFLKRYSPFFILILVVWLMLEMFYRNVPNNYSFKYQNAIKNKDSTTLLLFGNSHVLYGLNPKVFDQKTYNLSNISQTLYFDKLLFESYHAQFQNLKTIVLSVGYTSLTPLDNTGEDVWRKYYYHHFMDLKVPIVSDFSSKSYSVSLINNFRTSIRHVNTYMTKGTILDIDTTGFGYNYSKKNRHSIASVVDATINKHEDHLDDFSQNIEKINAIIKICEQRDINVVLLSMPVSRAYASRVNQNKKQKIFQTLQKIERENKHVFYLNLFEDHRFSDEDFYDADHLHSEGATKCSQMVNEYISNL